jgi:hypothetical protein
MFGTTELINHTIKLKKMGNELKSGDRVYSFDLDSSKVYGILLKNDTGLSEWMIRYDDGEECAVLDLSLVFKAA